MYIYIFIIYIINVYYKYLNNSLLIHEENSKEMNI